MSEQVDITPLAFGTKLTLKAGCVLIQDGGLSILVDPGHYGSRPVLDAALECAAGIRVADVDVVFFTHLHFDHYNDLGFSDIPRVVMPRKEKAAVESLSKFAFHIDMYSQNIRETHQKIAPVFMRQFLRFSNDVRYNFAKVSFRDRLVLADPGNYITPNVRTIDLAGHSVGQLGLDMTTQWGRTVVAGDAVLSFEDYCAGGIAHHLVVFDVEKLLAARQRLAKFNCIVPGHGAWFHPRTGQLARAPQEEFNV